MQKAAEKVSKNVAAAAAISTSKAIPNEYSCPMCNSHNFTLDIRVHEDRPRNGQLHQC